MLIGVALIPWIIIPEVLLALYAALTTMPWASSRRRSPSDRGLPTAPGSRAMLSRGG